MSKVNILGAGGGTFGHAFPLKKIISEIRVLSPSSRIFIAGVKDFERIIAEELGAEFIELKLKGLPRKLSPDLIRVPVFALKEAVRISALIRKEDVSAVITTGGYVSFPAAFGAVLARVPIFIHEQNSVLGLANRVCAPFASRIFLSIPLRKMPLNREKYILSGNPVRDEAVKKKKKSVAKKEFGFSEELPVVLFFGGSLGAQTINDMVKKIIIEFASGKEASFQVLHFTGARNFEKYEKELGEILGDSRELGWYRVFPEYLRMGDAYSAADLCVCRAGASTIAELEMNGIPALLVPYPFATGNHQFYNALYLKEKRAALVMTDDDARRMDGGQIVDLILRLLEDSRLKEAAARNAESLRDRRAERIIAENILNSLKQRL
jgi:UDP-N-acetylglucosamine--N-acetylmuramyl-(pentapeptide) pyrophosphoryl-undecaprenol N-acetylglucosamine transferase